MISFELHTSLFCSLVDLQKLDSLHSFDGDQGGLALRLQMSQRFDQNILVQLVERSVRVFAVIVGDFVKSAHTVDQRTIAGPRVNESSPIFDRTPVHVTRVFVAVAPFDQSSAVHLFEDGGQGRLTQLTINLAIAEQSVGVLQRLFDVEDVQLFVATPARDQRSPGVHLQLARDQVGLDGVEGSKTVLPRKRKFGRHLVRVLWSRLDEILFKKCCRSNRAVKSKCVFFHRTDMGLN